MTHVESDEGRVISGVETKVGKGPTVGSKGGRTLGRKNLFTSQVIGPGNRRRTGPHPRCMSSKGSSFCNSV